MLAKFSTKKPYTVFVAVVMVLVLGVVSFMKMSTDLLPNINLPTVMIMTSYVGASPETVEMTVSKPIEASMATVSNIEEIASVSSENYSLVTLQFTQTTDMDLISIEIREKLDQISSFWADEVGAPIIMKLNPNMLPIMTVSVGREDMSPAQVSDYVEHHISPRLESVEGVASVTESGLVQESVHVVIQQEKIDQINRQVFRSIDSEMYDAQKKIDDNRKDLSEKEQELEDSRQELEDGREEIQDARDELYDQEEELFDAREEATEQIGGGTAALIEAKAKLESNITALEGSIRQIEAQVGDIDALIKAYKQAVEKQLDQQLKQMLKHYEGGNPFTDEQKALLALLYGSDFIDDPSTTDAQIAAKIQETLAGFQTAEQYLKLTKTLEELKMQSREISQQIQKLTKGEIDAAAGFGSADSMISIGKEQLKATEKQLDQAQDQIESGQKQLDDARKQIDDAQDELNKTWKNAHGNADMHEVLTVETVKSLLAAQNFSMPAGYITEEGTSYLIRVGDKPDSVEELKTLPLLNTKLDGVDIITLGDVADVFMTDNSADSYSRVNGSPAVLLSFQKQTGYSTGDVSDALNQAFETMMQEEEGLSILTLNDQGIFIDMIMDSILSNMLWGGLLAVLILLAFLKDLRPTVIIAISIPVSVVAAVVCMYFSGVTLNIISLSGLALGIGMLVDNSIVVIENIYRLRNEGYRAIDAAVKGAGEVAAAITASTLTTVCVFAPIVFTEGITRQLFVDMGLTIAYSLGASLLVALTVVPALSSKMLDKVKENRQGGMFETIADGYAKTIPMALKHKGLVLVATVAALLVSARLALSLGTIFMPSMDSTELTVSLETPEGFTLEQTAALSDEILDRISSIEDVQDVGAMSASKGGLLGGSEADPNYVDIYVTLKEDKTHTAAEIGELILEQTKDLEQATLSVSAQAMDASTMSGGSVSVYVKGRDLDTLKELAPGVAQVVASVEGTSNVRDGLEETSEELRIRIDRDRAIRYGLTVGEIFQQINSRITQDNGSIELTTDTKNYDIFVIHQANEEMSREDIKNMELRYQDKDNNQRKVLLSEVAEFEDQTSLDSVSRRDQTRYVEVSAELKAGYNIGLVSQAVEQELAGYELPSGYSFEFAGENQMIIESMEQLFLMMVLAIIFMFLIMVAQFQSLKSPFIILFTIPLAFTGGLLGLYLSKTELSVIAVIGFVMLAGVIVNNGIVMVDYINQLKEAGMEQKAAIVEAGRTRLRPVIMTASTTILAMSTILFSHDMGADMSKPMTIVIVGGLIYGTLLTLYVVPCIYDIFNRSTKKQAQQAGDK